MPSSCASPSFQKHYPPHILSERIKDFFAGPAGPQMDQLRAALPKNCHVYVVGGLLRDLLVEKVWKIPINMGDVDLVVEGSTSAEEIHSVLSQFHVRRNDFGGVKCQVRDSGILFDIWRIADHVNMAKLPPPHTIGQLLRHFLLDVDALLWNPNVDVLYDYGAIQAIERGRIDLLGSEGISESLMLIQAVHVVSIAFKTGFELSERSKNFIQAACKDRSRHELTYLVDRKFSAMDEAGRSKIYNLFYGEPKFGDQRGRWQ